MLESDKDAGALGARACQCSFCRLHGASWTSDPTGSIHVTAHGPVHRYRFGTQSAGILVCGRCGAASVGTWRAPERGLLGVARVECLDARDALKAHLTETNFDGESVDDRLARRSRNWTPVTISGVVGDAPPA